MNLLQIWKNRKKVLGLNERTLRYLKKGKKNRAGIAIADDKLKTKKILLEKGIATPDLLGIIHDQKDLREFDWDNLPKSFVMKPVHGVQGGGIEIFYNRDKDTGEWIRSDGSKVSLEEIKRHAADILDGKFSLGDEPDSIFFEERIRTHEDLKNYTYKGAPDIRVIVFNKIPIMAYVRFPTRESKGKANMIIGAVGTGIDLASGITTTSTYGKGSGGRGFPIEYVEGTKLRYRGLVIPYWNKILRYAVETQVEVGLKFVAIDFLIDSKKGPVIVEINARPGLSIQLVNRAGLAWRLDKARGLKVKTIDQGIRLGKDLFGGEVEEEIERISGKEVISNVVPVRLHNEDKSLKVLALVDTSRRTSIMEAKTALKLGVINQEVPEDEYVMADVSMKIGSQMIDSELRVINGKTKGYRLLLGRKDLTDFIVDIKKVEKSEEAELKETLIASRPRQDFSILDSKLEELVKQIAILPSLRPINEIEEKEKFIKSKFRYNPQFQYNPIKYDPDVILEQLSSLNPPEDELGKIYADKIEELKKTVYLRESIGRDPAVFTSRSINLFGKPYRRSIQIANKVIKKYMNTGDNTAMNEPMLNAGQIKKLLEEEIKKYGLQSEVKIRKRDKVSNKITIGKVTGNIYLHDTCTRTPESVKGVIAHEIFTHLIRLRNGEKQEHKIFKIGTAGYIEAEEGLAGILGHIAMEDKLFYHPSILIKVITNSLSSDFVTTFKRTHKLVKDIDRCWNYTLRGKRGIADTSQVGGFTKDLYLQWSIQTGHYILNNPDAGTYLFNGKAKPGELKQYTKNFITPPPLQIKEVKKVLKENFIV